MSSATTVRLPLAPARAEPFDWVDELPSPHAATPPTVSPTRAIATYRLSIRSPLCTFF